MAGNSWWDDNTFSPSHYFIREILANENIIFNRDAQYRLARHHSRVLGKIIELVETRLYKLRDENKESPDSIKLSDLERLEQEWDSLARLHCDCHRLKDYFLERIPPSSLPSDPKEAADYLADLEDDATTIITKLRVERVDSIYEHADEKLRRQIHLNVKTENLDHLVGQILKVAHPHPSDCKKRAAVFLTSRRHLSDPLETPLKPIYAMILNGIASPSIIRQLQGEKIGKKLMRLFEIDKVKQPIKEGGSLSSTSPPQKKKSDVEIELIGLLRTIHKESSGFKLHCFLAKLDEEDYSKLSPEVLRYIHTPRFIFFTEQPRKPYTLFEEHAQSLKKASKLLQKKEQSSNRLSDNEARRRAALLEQYAYHHKNRKEKLKRVQNHVNCLEISDYRKLIKFVGWWVVRALFKDDTFEDGHRRFKLAQALIFNEKLDPLDLMYWIERAVVPSALLNKHMIQFSPGIRILFRLNEYSNERIRKIIVQHQIKGLKIKNNLEEVPSRIQKRPQVRQIIGLK